MVPFFPLFAWDFENKANTTLALRVESKVEELENIAEDSDEPSAEKKINSERLYETAKKKSLIKGPFIGLESAPLLKAGTKLSEAISNNSNDSKVKDTFYLFLPIYLNQLDISVAKKVLVEELNEENDDLKVYAESKTLRDLAMLAILLKAGKYFKRQDEAVSFVSKHFLVDDPKGYPSSYRPSSVKKSLEELKDSKRREAWMKLKGTINGFLNSED
jgi:hypothetical protein